MPKQRREHDARCPARFRRVKCRCAELAELEAAEAAADAADHESRPFVVTGRQPVFGTAPQGVVHLDPESPQTQRLVNAGHLTPAPSTTEGE